MSREMVSKMDMQIYAAKARRHAEHEQLLHSARRKKHSLLIS